MADSLLPLATLANTIKASIAAGDKAADKAEQHYKAAGLYLIEAKQIVSHTKQTWPAFCIAECNIGRRRADQLIELAEGRTSLVEIREGYAAANAKRNTGHVHAQSPEILGDPLSKRRMIITSAMRDLNLDKLVLLAKYAIWLQPLTDESAKAEMILADLRAKCSVETKRLAPTKKGAAPGKPLTPDELKTRRRTTNRKIDQDYFMQFGLFSGRRYPALYKLMADSLASGVDQLAKKRREQAEYVREETQRRSDLNAPLLAPITSEKERAYTRLIKTRALYEGACELSWEQYFEYRNQHLELTTLSRDDLEYAGMWTAYGKQAEAPAPHDQDTARIAA